MAVLGYK